MRLILAISFAIIAALGTAYADYPTRPIKLVVGFAAGGSTDTAARTLGLALTEILGQPIIIENRPGASGSIAASFIANAAPDGYTIGLATTAALATNLLLQTQISYDPRKNLTPIGRVGEIPSVVIATPRSNITSMADLVRAAKEKPGSLTIGHGGIGTAMHLAIEKVKQVAGIEVVLVPYKGTASAVTDVIAGQIPLGVVDLTTAAPHAKAGTLRVLAITSNERTKLAPEIPTIKEAGLTDYESYDAWLALIAPEGTPPDIVGKLNGALVQAMDRPPVRERLQAVGIEPKPSSAEVLKELISTEIARLTVLIKAVGISAN